MAAVFPNTKKTFTQIVDGTTYMEAVNMNVAYDEIEAMQTFIGAIGSTQANSDSIKNLLADYRKNAEVEYKGAADLYVRAGELMISDASNNRRLRRNTSDTTVTWADIDAGAEANSTTYYVYAVADAAGTAFTILISTNAATPTGGTFYRKIGSFYNDSGGDIDAQRIIGRLEVDDAPPVRKRTGTYTGDAAATLAITGLGFQPKCVHIYQQAAGSEHAFKTDQDGTKAYLIPSGGTGNVYLDDHIISLDADGFTVGDGTGLANYMNVNATVYTYIAETW